MPRVTLPPTPQPSGDIAGKAAPHQPDSSFALPPAALSGSNRSSASSTTASSAASNASDSSYRPLSPPSPLPKEQQQQLLATTSSSFPPTSSPPTSSRKRTSTASHQGSAIGNADYSLPPPPTRSRKIIQMKPRAALPVSNPSAAPNTAGLDPSKSASGNNNKGGTAGGKRKQANNNGGGGSASAAGRKIARKTAHSLIERRRRSKMNEEFGTLRDLVPACRGQEMHKLAILQASIEYMRYLEQCVAGLKGSRVESATNGATTSNYERAFVLPSRDDDDMDEVDVEVEPAMAEQENSDTYMHDISSSATTLNRPQRQNQREAPIAPPPLSTNVSPEIHPISSAQSTAASPALCASNSHHRSSVTSPYVSASSNTTTTNISPVILPSEVRHRSLSSLPSPAISARGSTTGSVPSHQQPLPPFPSRHSSALTSPALRPLDEEGEREDREATAALLMLGSDRRSWASAGSAGRGDGQINEEKHVKEKVKEKGRRMSVKDLLSH